MKQNEMAAIYDRWCDTVYRAALAYCKSVQDAEDITQEVFLARFAEEIAFPSPAAEKAWLLRVTINKSLNLLHSIPHTRHVPLEAAMSVCETVEEHAVMDAVNRLPAKYRVLVHLYYVEGYTVREIAEMTSQTETAVQTQLYRARKRLKRMLKEDFDT